MTAPVTAAPHEGLCGSSHHFTFWSGLSLSCIQNVFCVCNHLQIRFLCNTHCLCADTQWQIWLTNYLCLALQSLLKCPQNSTNICNNNCSKESNLQHGHNLITSVRHSTANHISTRTPDFALYDALYNAIFLDEPQRVDTRPGVLFIKLCVGFLLKVYLCPKA